MKLILPQFIFSFNYTGLPPNQGIQGKVGNFIFNQGKSEEKERYFEKSGKIRKVRELLLFHFRVATFSILSHTQLSMKIAHFPLFFYCIVFCAVILKRSSVFYGTKNIELPDIGSRLFQTPHLLKEMIRISGKIRGK